MKAIRIHQPGGPEVLRYEEAPDPVPASHEVLIQVAAAGINFSDIGARRNADTTHLPMIPGSEAAGAVIALGDGVTEFRIGDLVACQYQPAAGCYAERVAASVNGTIKLPPGVKAEDAAAVMLQGRTAYAMAFQAYRTKAGDRVLVHAAAGGVGLLLTQMTKRAGAFVFATVGSDDKILAAQEAGADHVINYSNDDFVAVVNEVTSYRGVNAIFDSVGKATFPKGLDCLASRGVVVSFGQASGPSEPFDLERLGRMGGYVTRTNARRFAPSRDEWRHQVNEVFDRLLAGHLRVQATSYPLAKAADAHRDLEGRGSIGKLLLIP